MVARTRNILLAFALTALSSSSLIILVNLGQPAISNSKLRDTAHRFRDGQPSNSSPKTTQKHVSPSSEQKLTSLNRKQNQVDPRLHSADNRSSGVDSSQAGRVDHSVATSGARMKAAFAQIPLFFEGNQGQTDKQVKFLSRGPGYSLFLTANEAVLRLRSAVYSAQSKRGLRSRQLYLASEKSDISRHYRTAVVRMKFVNANPDSYISGLDQLPGKSSYFIGNDPGQWQTSLTQYAKVKYKEIYPGIDLLFYGSQGKLEYDFVVSAHADLKAIKLQLDGLTGHARIDQSGAVVVRTACGEVFLNKPVIYQLQDGKRRELNGRYALQGRNQVGF